MREVIESDFQSHASRVMNSSNLLVGVSSHACARAACGAVASASPSCTRLSPSHLSAVVVAHAAAFPLHHARNSVAFCS